MRIQAPSYNVPINLGSESSAYLQYILDHYDCLPRWTLFLHGHGQTGREMTGGRHHPTNASRVAAMIDVDAIDRGFVAVGHIETAPNASTFPMHPAAQAFSSTVPMRQRHAMAFVPLLEHKMEPGCTCELMLALLRKALVFEAKPRCAAFDASGGSSRLREFDCPPNRCMPGWSWPVGAEFWASAGRIRMRSREYWEVAMSFALRGQPVPRFDNRHSQVTSTAYCFETLWHHLLGEPLRHYSPLYASLEEYPLVAERVAPEPRIAARARERDRATFGATAGPRKLVLVNYARAIGSTGRAVRSAAGTWRRGRARAGRTGETAQRVAPPLVGVGRYARVPGPCHGV